MYVISCYLTMVEGFRFTNVRKKNKFKGFLKLFRHRGKYKKVEENKADLLIVKLIENTISEQESKWLSEWLQDEEHQAYFESFVEVHYLMQTKSKFDPYASLDKVKRRIDPKPKRLFPSVLKYAAAIVILLASGYLVFNHSESISETSTVSNSTIISGSDKATLTLEDGSEVVLDKGTTYQTGFAESDGEKIVYQNKKEHPTEVVYNFLTVPRGGQFFIQLADETKVWLNSETQLKYPKSFTDGKYREVELVYGEAYFEVSPSNLHDGAPFKVVSKEQKIEVLGTQFNIKAYRDETVTYTTLVEGKIALESYDQTEILQPDQQAIVSHNEKSMIIVPVEVYNEVSWKDGVFSFKEKPLKDIMVVLARWYDMNVVFQNTAMEDLTFRGVLGKDQSIEDILSAIKMANIINAYEINDKTITIK